MELSRFLNIVGIGILTIEAFGARESVEALIDGFRIRLFKLLKSYWFVFLVPAGFAVMEGYTIFTMINERSASIADIYYISIIVLVLGAILYLALLSSFYLFGVFLHVIDRFPQGSVAGLGALTAVFGLILDFLPQ